MDILPSVQFGFREGHFTNIQLLRVSNHNKLNLENGRYRSDADARRLFYGMDSILRSCGFILDIWRSNRSNLVPQNSAAT